MRLRAGSVRASRASRGRAGAPRGRVPPPPGLCDTPPAAHAFACAATVAASAIPPSARGRRRARARSRHTSPQATPQPTATPLEGRVALGGAGACRCTARGAERGARPRGRGGGGGGRGRMPCATLFGARTLPEDDIKAHPKHRGRARLSAGCSARSPCRPATAGARARYGGAQILLTCISHQNACRERPSARDLRRSALETRSAMPFWISNNLRYVAGPRSESGATTQNAFPWVGPQVARAPCVACAARAAAFTVRAVRARGRRAQPGRRRGGHARGEGGGGGTEPGHINERAPWLACTPTCATLPCLSRQFPH